jgi:nitroimidazol reductase NimA-like FMN-containing flavoprotein (pyridoxamine 5'-phosphate oxidase superfamily)
MEETPAFLASDARRSRYAWTDWPEVRAFLHEQRACRIAVHDVPWPYVVGMTYAFDGAAFHLRFSRTGKLAACLRANALCTIEVADLLGVDEDAEHDTRSARYRSVVARCDAQLRDHDIGEGRTILAVTARVVGMSGKRRLSA